MANARKFYIISSFRFNEILNRLFQLGDRSLFNLALLSFRDLNWA